MTNIASLLKTEIARVARKEVRQETIGLRKAVAAHRSEIVALKRRAAALEQELRRVKKGRAATAEAVSETTGTRGLRFSAKGLASQRKRLSLSAHDCGLLIGASGQSVYNWEDGKTRPQARHLPAIAALRSMGKKEAAARLAVLQAAA